MAKQVLPVQIQRFVSNFVLNLKRNELHGSSTVALSTSNLLKDIILRGKYATVKDILEAVREVGRQIMAARPVELSMGNVVRRVLFIIRQELASSLKAKVDKFGPDGTALNQQEETVDLSRSLLKLLENDEEMDYNQEFKPALKGTIVEAIVEMQAEIQGLYATIGEQAVEHVHAKETILTFGFSKTVCTFLKEAAGFRKFEVMVAESAPSLEGQRMAAYLAELGIETTVITDSAVFAMMRTVNKIIISPHSVMANGGVLTHCGGHNIAVAAKHHSVPVLVVSGVYKLCPLYAFDQDTFNVQNPPSQILNFEDEGAEKVSVENPAFDYIPPEYITLFITNLGGHNPSYIHRVLNDYYYPQDYDL